jgi:DNA-binding MurR/RpiR family transcriptional regulator
MLLMIIYGSFADDVEKDIAINLLQSSDKIDSLLLSTLAESCQCSTAVITRFIKKLGFDSFKRLKTQMNLTKKVRLNQLKTHVELSTSEEIWLHLQSLCRNFDDGLLKEQVCKVNSMIHESSSVLIIGAAYPQALCLHYAEDMLIMGKPIYTIPAGYQFKLPRRDENCMVMVISFTGRLLEYFHSEIQKLYDSKEQLCVITSADLSEVENERIAVITLPFRQDNENANSWFIEMLRYMKTEYYHTYME